MSAKDFFLGELPPIIAAIKQAMGDAIPKLSYDLEIEIDGEGMYTVQVKAGEATVRRGGAAEPLVAMSFAKTTWDDALERIVRPRLQQLATIDRASSEAFAKKELERQLGGRKPVAPEQMLAALKALPLRVLLEVAGTKHRFELKLAGAEEDDPTVTITAAEADIEQIVGGKISVQDAFKQGKIKLKGAVTTVMALLSRVFVA